MPRHRDLTARVRRRRAALVVLAASGVAVLAIFLLRGGEHRQVPLRELVGQTVVGRMGRSGPTADLLERVRRGRIGGVVAFPASSRALGRDASRLLAAARATGAPPPLIAIDQEGGPVKRLPGPPLRSPRQLGEAGSRSAAEREGRRTGRYLGRLGVSVNLAPVLDVPSEENPRSLSSRAFSSDPGEVADLGTAWAEGLESAGVAATAKHFPGLGLANANTDFEPVRVDASPAELEEGMEPFAGAIDAGVPVVMVSTATYPALDSAHGAAWSPAVIAELRDRLGFEGVVATDDLEGAAVRKAMAPAAAAVESLRAGADLMLLVGTERGSARAYERILRAARAGQIDRSTLERAHGRVRTLKDSLAG